MDHRGEICFQFTEREITYLTRVASTLPVNQQSPFQKWARLWTHVNRQFQGQKPEVDVETTTCNDLLDNVEAIQQKISPYSLTIVEESVEQKVCDTSSRKNSRLPKMKLPSTCSAKEPVKIEKSALSRSRKMTPSTEVGTTRLRTKQTTARVGRTAISAPSSKATSDGTIVRKPVAITRRINVKNTQTSKSEKTPVTASSRMLDAGNEKFSKLDSSSRTKKIANCGAITAGRCTPKNKTDLKYDKPSLSSQRTKFNVRVTNNNEPIKPSTGDIINRKPTSRIPKYTPEKTISRINPRPGSTK